MKKIAILLDSTCDFSPELLERFGLDYVPMSVSIDDKEYVADLGWKSISPKEYYDLMRAGKRVYTVQVGEPAFREKFGKYLDEGCDVLYISCSSALSASIKAGERVAEEMMKERPGSVIRCLDPLMSGMGQGMIGIKASELRAEGKSIDEIVEYLEKTKLRYNQWGTVDSLTYLKNAGRVKAAKAFFGNLFGVKPIIISDARGANFAYKKEKGRKASLDEVANSVLRTIEEAETNYVCISGADCEEDVAYVKGIIEKGLEEKGLKVKGILTGKLGPILGASCGPKTLITYNYGPEVTIIGD